MKLLQVTDIKLIVLTTVIPEIPKTSYSCTGFRHQVDRGRKRVSQEMLLLQEMFGSVRKGKTYRTASLRIYQDVEDDNMSLILSLRKYDSCIVL